VLEKHFSRERILTALQALGDELTRRGVRGQIFIVGGAAMALAYSTRRITKDVDAVFEPKALIYEAAAQVAEELGLPEPSPKTRLFLEEILGPGRSQIP